MYFYGRPKVLSTCFSLCLVLSTQSVFAGKLFRKNDYINLEVYQNYTGECWGDMKKSNFQQIPNSSKFLCKHGDNYYDSGADFYDYARCSKCLCMAPNVILCCKKKLIPEDMPESCEVDPAGRFSRVRPFGHCMASIVQKLPSGRSKRRREICRNRKLTELLMRHAAPYETIHGRRRKIILVAQEGNVKRHVEVSQFKMLAEALMSQSRSVLQLRKGEVINYFSFK